MSILMEPVTRNLSSYGTRAETVFVIPTDENTFLAWLRARAARDAGIGSIPSLKFYHYSHLDTAISEGIAGSKELAIRRWQMVKGSWNCIPYLRVNVIPLSNRRDNAQCEVWVTRLRQEFAFDGGELYEDGANAEYDRLVADIQIRWPNTIVSSSDYRTPESYIKKSRSDIKTLEVIGKADSTYRQKLRKLLDVHFNEDELRTLCFDLGIDYDSLSGDGKSGEIRELLARCERHHQLNELVAIVREERPSIIKDLERQ